MGYRASRWPDLFCRGHRGTRRLNQRFGHCQQRLKRLMCAPFQALVFGQVTQQHHSANDAPISIAQRRTRDTSFYLVPIEAIIADINSMGIAQYLAAQHTSKRPAVFRQMLVMLETNWIA